MYIMEYKIVIKKLINMNMPYRFYCIIIDNVILLMHVCTLRLQMLAGTNFSKFSEEPQIR